MSSWRARWWSESDRARPLLSVEEGIAKTLGIKLGDKLTYEIAGVRLEGEVASLRKVEWDSFRVNFFVVTPPGVLEAYPASYVTSFHLAADRSALMDQLVKRFPNFLVIDVAAVLGQVQRIMDQVVKAVEFVFLFGLLAGLVVLFAAISATHDERVFDAAIMRTRRRYRATDAVGSCRGVRRHRRSRGTAGRDRRVCAGLGAGDPGTDCALRCKSVGMAGGAPRRH